MNPLHVFSPNPVGRGHKLNSNWRFPRQKSQECAGKLPVVEMGRIVYYDSHPQAVACGKTLLAGVVELADTIDLGSIAARRAGSSPVSGTEDNAEERDESHASAFFVSCGLVCRALPAVSDTCCFELGAANYWPSRFHWQYSAGVVAIIAFRNVGE